MDSTFDWQALILRLEATGLKLGEVGRLAGLSPSSISDLKAGSSRSPRGLAAVRLFEIGRSLDAGTVTADSLRGLPIWPLPARAAKGRRPKAAKSKAA